ncbi:MAG TPA: hypothetical protein VNX01_09080 [Bacteroidia bacterium]|nr:hypothetical protein [Bacteroidia bacterium]
MKTTILIFVLCLFNSTLNAQQDGYGPHKGRLKKSGNYQIELVGCINYLEVYLFDTDTQVIDNSSIIGNIVFIYDSKSSLSKPLVHYGLDGFTAQMPTNTFQYCKPSFNINGIIITAKFENECQINASKN